MNEQKIDSSNTLRLDLNLRPQQVFDLAHDDGGREAVEQLQAGLERGIADLSNVALPQDDLVQLWTKAIDDSKSVTRDERLQILERWPPEEYDAQCQARTGQAFEDLRSKALHHPNDLSGLEANILLYGPSFGTHPRGQSLGSQRLKWPADLRAKRHAAEQAVETEQDRTVRENAQQAQSRVRKEEREARQRLDADDRHNIVWCNKANWVQKLDQDFKRKWGFTLYRTTFDDDGAWQRYKEHFEAATRTALLLVQNSDFIRRRWEIQWIEDRDLGDASLATLCRDFNARLNNSSDTASDTDSGILSYLRSDAFLFADREAIQSVSPNPSDMSRTFVYAVDSTYCESRLSKYRHGFTGALKVSLPHVMTTFYARLDPSADPNETKKMKQSWDVMFYKARYDQEHRTYPPRSLFNRGL